MQVLKITWAPATKDVLSGSYTLSHGITPSAVTLECVRFEGQIPAVSDVLFSDGEDSITIKDALFFEKGSHNSGSGRTRTVTLQDRRWRWKFGTVQGRYNELINRTPPTPEQMESPDFRSETKSARDLAEELLGSMGETGYDISALPTDDYPETVWDFIPPAQALADLCDEYQLLIAFDPETCKVTLCKKGEGTEPSAACATSDDVNNMQAVKPKTLRAVCNWTEHEDEFELEAVGIEIDGTVKLADLAASAGGLSYRPAAGWGADILDFAGVPETEVTDPDHPNQKTTHRKLAAESVYRLYRVVPKTPTKWTEPGWGLEPAGGLVKLNKLLPLSKHLVQVVEGAKNENGNPVNERRPAYVFGIFLPDVSVGTATANSAANTIYPKSFELDERKGLVKFSEPVFSFDGSGNPIAPTLKLRCVVHADRYTKDKEIGGSYGIETVDCSDLTLQYQHNNLPGVEWNNKNEINAKIAKVLDERAKRYDATRNGSRTYPGIWPEFELDGLVQQVTFQIDGSGALTTVSVNSEHNPWVPPAQARRRHERANAPSWSPAPAGQPAPSSGGPDDLYKVGRSLGASNAYAGAVPAFSLVSVTALAGRIATVTRPAADSLAGLAVTGPSPIPQSSAGLCSMDWPLPVKYAGNAPAIGDERGSAANSFQLTTGKKGFLVVGVDAGLGLAWIVPQGTSGSGGGGGVGDVFTPVDSAGASNLTADNAWHDLAIGAAGYHGVSIAVAWYPANAAETAEFKCKGHTNSTTLTGVTPGVLQTGKMVIGCDAAGTIQYKFPTNNYAYAGIQLLGYWAPAT